MLLVIDTKRGCRQHAPFPGAGCGGKFCSSSRHLLATLPAVPVAGLAGLSLRSLSALLMRLRGLTTGCLGCARRCRVSDSSRAGRSVLLGRLRAGVDWPAGADSLQAWPSLQHLPGSGLQWAVALAS